MESSGKRGMLYSFLVSSDKDDSDPMKEIVGLRGNLNGILSIVRGQYEEIDKIVE